MCPGWNAVVCIRYQSAKRFFGIEQERLTQLIHEWMEYERERRHFEVLDTESKKTVQLDGLSFKLKVDRIDQTPDGKTILIDYKTGLVPNLKKWFGERIEEPQLPLYSMEVNADAWPSPLSARAIPGTVGCPGKKTSSPK